MQPALTTMVSSLNDDRRDAISWLVESAALGTNAGGFAFAEEGRIEQAA